MHVQYVDLFNDACPSAFNIHCPTDMTSDTSAMAGIRSRFILSLIAAVELDQGESARLASTSVNTNISPQPRARGKKKCDRETVDVDGAVLHCLVLWDTLTSALDHHVYLQVMLVSKEWKDMVLRFVPPFTF
jgi:hypothetical protein